jgi:hypothetical protein
MQFSSSVAPPAQGLGYVARFIDAVRQVFWYVLFGCVVGFGLVLLSEYVNKNNKHEFFGKLLEHVGMGFIVAAIAVLFYEWGAHLKAVERVSSELTGLREAVAAQALSKALEVYMNTGDHDFDRKVIDSITSILNDLKRLQDQGDWTQTGFQRFINAMLDKVSINSGRLADLSGQLRTNPTRAASYNVEVHTPAQLVDTILAEQMALLPERGRYSVVTNPQDWQEGHFPQLLRESKIAVEQRFIVIRRILVLADSGPNGYEGGDPNEIERILDLHSANAQASATPPGAGYGFKVLDDYERKRLRKLKGDAAGNLFINHFAIIDKRDSDHCLEIRANDPGLSDFQLAGVPRDSQYIKWFDLVWDNLPELNAAMLAQIMERWKAAHPPPSHGVLEKHG